MNNSIANTLDLLRQEFPNLEWKPYKGNKDQVHGFTASFCDWWELTVEVQPMGCMARLRGGRSLIAVSPNEQDKSLEEVIAHVRNEWEKITHAMSK
jgi:hypothetical protein